MPASIAPSAAPPHAILIWCDHQRVYIQLASPHGPCVLDYPRDVRGIGEILLLMRERHVVEAAGVPYSKPPLPTIKRDDRFTPKQRNVVAELLRRKGITGR